jgi:hypothetical protein
VASASPHVVDSSAAPQARGGVRQRLALFYIGLSLLALVPGMFLKFGVELPGQSALASALYDIQFGSGLRFWLGVTGATMMALLLFYPLRKLFSRSRILGSIGGWFQLHILLGLLGPVCILYHCNFGHGSSNANVALWSMLVVALSGIAGTFAYGRASHDFYTTRQLTLQHRDAIMAALSELNADVSGREALAAAFETFQAGLLTPRRGIVRGIIARLRVERSRLIITHMIKDILAARARRQELTRDDVRQIKGPLAQHLKRYMVVARSAASQSIREQIWARWRMFHVPVFLIMIVAASLHVIAVWDLDATGAASGTTQSRTAVDTPTFRVAGMIESRDSHDPIETLLRDDASQAAGAYSPVLTAPPQLVTARNKPASNTPEKKPDTIAAADVPSPTRALRPAPAALLPAVPAPPLLAVAAPRDLPAAAQPQIEAVYAELQKRDAAQPMALGGAKPRTLADQIATLKALRENKQFFHSETETGFALAGKHLKVECASCHTVPLRQTRQPEPRACIACHRKDDVHSGRRPDCAQCHTTNRWSQIVRRR